MISFAFLVFLYVFVLSCSIHGFKSNIGLTNHGKSFSFGRVLRPRIKPLLQPSKFRSESAGVIYSSADDASEKIEPMPAVENSTANPVTSLRPEVIQLNSSSLICECASCGAAYLWNKTTPSLSMRVKCSVCGKEWYQHFAKLVNASNDMELVPFSMNKIQFIREALSNNMNPKRVDRSRKHVAFVRMLPFSFTETDLIDLFAEYGVVSCYIVRDDTETSKGFGFIEVRAHLFSRFATTIHNTRLYCTDSLLSRRI
jgi:hypothetical protein